MSLATWFQRWAGPEEHVPLAGFAQRRKRGSASCAPALLIELSPDRNGGTRALSEDSQRAPRIEAVFETMYWVERQEGDGVVANISSSGALLENTSLRLDRGTKVRLSLLVEPEKRVELTGVVARHVATGFAVAFAPSSSGAVRHLMNEIVAGSPSRNQTA